MNHLFFNLWAWISKDAKLKTSQYISTLSSYTTMQNKMYLRNKYRHTDFIFSHPPLTVWLLKTTSCRKKRMHSCVSLVFSLPSIGIVYYSKAKSMQALPLHPFILSCGTVMCMKITWAATMTCKKNNGQSNHDYTKYFMNYHFQGPEVWIYSHFHLFLEPELSSLYGRVKLEMIYIATNDCVMPSRQ